MGSVGQRAISRATPGANRQRSYSGDYMKVGKEAEQIVLNWLKERPWVLGVEDFRQLRQVHEADIDFGVKLVDGRVTLAEVKSDWHLGKSGNVLFEILRINHTCQPDKACVLGWSARSPAVWFLYYAPQVKSIYQCRADELRQAFQAYTREARGDTRRVWVDTDSIKSTLNVLIPWRYCESFFTIHKLEG